MRCELLPQLLPRRHLLCTQGVTLGPDRIASTWISWWLENVGAAKPDSSASTEDNYRWALEQVSSIGGKRLRELTTADVEGLLRHLSSRKPSQRNGRSGRRGPLGKSSLLRVRFALGVVLEEAQRRDMIGRNVARLARLPRSAEASRPRRSLSPTEADDLMDAAREDKLDALGQIGITGFGGPPTHIALLRRLCVDQRRWLDAREFEDGIAAVNLLPGPASSQLAIFCAWRLRGAVGGLLGGVCFIVPGLVVILGLSALLLASHPPRGIEGAAAGAGARSPPSHYKQLWLSSRPAGRGPVVSARTRCVGLCSWFSAPPPQSASARSWCTSWSRAG